ncbi:MAG TPA: 2-phosphosulfolactate phosphatase [Planctomycetaceae bacterium]|jgi:2-phosphosulfolactate phosphatase|nr:2-phosphosulfolactate phosphatase [Planctomycetaceae bacterium]
MPRQVNVFPLPRYFEPDELRGGIAVVIDLLRASTTIVTALANGARCVIPCGDVAAAQESAASFPRGDVLLGGERGGVRIEGFDLDNSPATYSSDRVAGKTVVFTTTNGTAALLRSQAADRVLVGSLVNRRAVVRELAGDERPVHLVCAGTEGCVTAEDLLAAGAFAAELAAAAGSTSSRDDVAFVVQEFWASASSSSGQLRTALRQSRGGRNLVELGFDADIELAARVDSVQVVAEYFATEGRIEPVR